MRILRICPVALLAVSPLAAQSIVIDTFNGGPILETLSAPGTVGGFVDDAGILQGERNIRVSGSSVAGGNITGQVATNLFSFNRPAGSNGTIEIWWDGNNNSTSFAPTGLGGVDLTANTQNAFQIQSSSSSSTVRELIFYVWTSGSDISRLTFTLPTGSGTVVLPYQSFAVFGGTGADFSNVGALFMGTGSGADQAWSASLDDIRTIHSDLMFSDGLETGNTSRWSSVAL